MVLSASGQGHLVLSQVTTVRICIELLRLVVRFLVRAAGFSELHKLNQSRLKTAIRIAMGIAPMAMSSNGLGHMIFIHGIRVRFPAPLLKFYSINSVGSE